MGAYVNPPDATKEAWLERHGTPLPSPPKAHDETAGNLPVCLVDNGLFTAAAIAYSDYELEAFADPADYRRKRWYSVSEELLHTVSRELERYQKQAGVRGRS